MHFASQAFPPHSAASMPNIRLWRCGRSRPPVAQPKQLLYVCACPPTRHPHSRSQPRSSSARTASSAHRPIAPRHQQSTASGHGCLGPMLGPPCNQQSRARYPHEFGHTRFFSEPVLDTLSLIHHCIRYSHKVLRLVQQLQRTALRPARLRGNVQPQRDLVDRGPQRAGGWGLRVTVETVDMQVGGG